MVDGTTLLTSSDTRNCTMSRFFSPSILTLRTKSSSRPAKGPIWSPGPDCVATVL